MFCRALDSHLRVTQAETLGITRKPHTEMTPHRDYHSDPPHDVADGDRAGAIDDARQPADADVQERTDTGEQEDGGKRQLNRLGDLADLRKGDHRLGPLIPRFYP